MVDNYKYCINEHFFWQQQAKLLAQAYKADSDSDDNVRSPSRLSGGASDAGSSHAGGANSGSKEAIPADIKFPLGLSGEQRRNLVNVYGFRAEQQKKAEEQAELARKEKKRKEKEAKERRLKQSLASGNDDNKSVMSVVNSEGVVEEIMLPGIRDGTDMAEYQGLPRDFKLCSKNKEHNQRSINYTLNDLRVLNYDKAKKFADLKFENHSATVKKVMKQLKTNQPAVADKQIKNNILKEVRQIQARVDARKYRVQKQRDLEDEASMLGVQNDVMSSRSKSETRSLSPSKQRGPSPSRKDTNLTVQAGATNLKGIMKAPK